MTHSLDAFGQRLTELVDVIAARSATANHRAMTSVLIVEDSRTQAVRLQNMLEKHGFKVAVARNGQLALDHLHEAPDAKPELIISDIQMPVMDGYELCRRIKGEASLADIPLILLTSLSAPQDIVRGLESGADNFVMKPYADDFLLSRMQSAMANHRLSAPVAGEAIAVHFAGERYEISAGRRQVLSLLLSTYETAVQTNRDLIATHEQLKSVQAQLIEAEKLQSTGRLAAGVAHEVRNPLAILEMGMGFLAEQALPDTAQVVLDEMREAVRRANEVIMGLMEMASPREMGMHAADLHHALEHALAPLAPEFTRAGITIEREFAAALPAIQLDEARITQAFINLFTNALHSMPDGGTLTLRTEVRQLAAAEVAFDAGDRSGVRFRAGERAIIAEVSDTGTGIAPENLDKLFEPFFSTKPTGKGMGLGLTVAKKMIELHRGTIAVRNGAEGGAVVTMMFKLA